MKFLQIFNKTPNHKKFNFTTRFYDPQEEERKERERRIRLELENESSKGNSLQEDAEDENFAYRKRIAGSFRTAKKTVTVQKDPSATLMRLIIFTILTVGLIAYLHYGKDALYVIMLVIAPVYLFWRFKTITKKNIQR